MLSASTASVQETSISNVTSGIVTRYLSLVTTVDTRMSLLEKSVDMHQQYTDEYCRCQEMIVNERQRLQQIFDGSCHGIVAARQWMDQPKVLILFKNSIVVAP